MGWIKSAHGIRGEVYVQLYAEHADWNPHELKTLHLLEPKQSTLKSRMVKVCRPHKQGLIVALDGIDDRNQSEVMRSSGVYIPETALEAEPGERIFLKQILGFKLCDPDGKNLGEIIGFSSNGVQDLLHIKRENGAEALVPLVDKFIVNIDFDKQQVKMDLPQGLLTLEEE